VGGPDEGLGFAVVLAEVAVDRGLQVDQRVEDAALQAPAGERGEEGLDRIGPGARGGREMERPARVPGEPGAHLGVLVGGIVIEDRVNELAGRHGGLDAVEETDEFLVAMARHALADHRAVEDIQRSEQRGRAVPDIIVGHRPGPTFLHRQTRLGAVERLNLRLLVDRQHETVGRRVDIQPDHIAQLGGKGRILRQLEAPYPVRLSVGTGHLAGLIWRDGLSGS